MIEFLPEREDLITWFDTNEDYRVFVKDYGRTDRQGEKLCTLTIVHLPTDEQVYDNWEIEQEFWEEDTYYKVSEFLANQ